MHSISCYAKQQYSLKLIRRHLHGPYLLTIFIKIDATVASTFVLDMTFKNVLSFHLAKDDMGSCCTKDDTKDRTNSFCGMK